MRREMAAPLRHASVGVLAFVLAAAAVRPADANGVNTHTWISFHAIEHLPDGELKRLLGDPEMRAPLINGSIFPDGGYAVDSPFGEAAHWEPFITAYLRWMQGNVARPFARGEARPYVAFLMGVASHGMGDQVFDSTFMKAARGYDAANWSESLLDSFDTATDVMLVDETGVDYRGTELWVPSEELVGVFAEVGVTVDAAKLVDATSAMHSFVLAYGAVNGRDPAAVERYRMQYPWASQHFMDPDEVGNPLCEGEVVAAYWQSLWDRLHEVEAAENMILSTYPSAGSDGHPTDPALVEAQVIVVFGRGLAGEVRDRFRVTDSTGKVYDTSGGPWRSEANLVAITPDEPWAADETFTVEVLPGIATIDGHTYDQPWSFQFSTRPASGPRDPMSDPTPHVGEPWTGPPDEEPGDGGGCAAGGGGGGGAGAGGILAIGLFGFVRAAMRRPRRRAAR